MDKRELFSWAASVGAGLPVAALMLHEMFVIAAIVAVLLAVGGIALLSWPDRRRECHWTAGETRLDSSDAFTVRASRS
jgi:hypothetical protein